jgi:hypothetical protein
VPGRGRQPGAHPGRVIQPVDVLQQPQPGGLRHIGRVALDQLEVAGHRPDEPRVLIHQALPRPPVAVRGPPDQRRDVGAEGPLVRAAGGRAVPRCALHPARVAGQPPRLLRYRRLLWYSEVIAILRRFSVAVMARFSDISNHAHRPPTPRLPLQAHLPCVMRRGTWTYVIRQQTYGIYQRMHA